MKRFGKRDLTSALESQGLPRLSIDNATLKAFENYLETGLWDYLRECARTFLADRNWSKREAELSAS